MKVNTHVAFLEDIHIGKLTMFLRVGLARELEVCALAWYVSRVPRMRLRLVERSVKSLPRCCVFSPANAHTNVIWAATAREKNRPSASEVGMQSTRRDGPRCAV